MDLNRIGFALRQAARSLAWNLRGPRPPKMSILVDAGYLLMACESLSKNWNQKRGHDFDGAAAIVALRKALAPHFGIEALNAEVLWFDAVVEGAAYRHSDVERGAAKIRLGRISHNRQKGVDALLAMEILELAHEDPEGTTVLISGDEDLLPAVERASGLGRRTVLTTVDGNPHDCAPSRRLVAACADHRLLSAVSARGLVGLDADGSPRQARGAAASEEAAADLLRETASDVVEELLRTGEAKELFGLASNATLPHRVDARLLLTARIKMGRLLNDKERAALRRIFLAAVAAEAPRAEAEA